MKRQLTPDPKGKMPPATSRLPEDVIEYIDKVAYQQFRSRSDIIRTFIMDHLRDKGVIARIGAEPETAA